MIPDRVLTANLDASCEAGGLCVDDVMVSWLPLYHDMGLVGFLAHPDDHRHAARPGRAAGLHGQARCVDAVDQRLRRHRDGRPELRLGAGHPGARADARISTCPADAGAERGRAGRPAGRRRVRQGRRAVRVPRRRRVPRVRHGRGGHRRDVPAARPRHGRRHRRPARARARPRRQADRPRPGRRGDRRPPPPAARHAGARPGDARRRSRDVRGPARAARRRAAAARHVGDARLLQAARRHRRAVPRRLAVHRRPRLRRATASWCCAGGSRT